MVSASHKARLITSAIGLPFIAASVLLGGIPLFAMVLAISLVGLWEFFGLFPGGSGSRRVLGLALGTLLLALCWRFGPAGSLTALFAALWMEELVRLFRHGGAGSSLTEIRPRSSLDSPALPNSEPPDSPRWLLLSGLLFVPGSLQFLLTFGPGETALVMAVVMATDTGAYYCGLHIGGPKIWPAVSPKKTWAGSLGGLAAALAVCLIAGTAWSPAPLWTWLLLGLCLSAASQMGDFVESSLKRRAGVKDSGTILPGHGGLLDRIDGFLPAVLVYALARQLVVFL